MLYLVVHIMFFFFNDTATTEIYPLSLHDALPIFATRAGTPVGCRHSTKSSPAGDAAIRQAARGPPQRGRPSCGPGDRKSTRLNSSHANISYAGLCFKKKKCDVYSTTQHPLHHSPA